MRRIIDWYYGKATIRRKLVISYLILVLLPVIILGTYSYSVAKKNLLTQTRDTVQNSVSSITYNLKTNIEREDDNLKYLSYNFTFREKLESARQNMTALVKEMNQSVEPVFWYFITSDRNMKGIEIYSPYIDHALGSFLEPETACREEEWYAYHQKKFNTLWTVEGDRIFATRTLLDAATSSRPIGIMKLEVFTESFIEPLFKAQYLENGVLLLDADRQVIGGKMLENEALDKEIRTRILETTDTGMYETKDYILSAGEPFGNGWRLFYYVDKQEIAGDINKIFKSTLFVSGACLLIVTVLISVISRILSSRILKLKQCAEKVGQGEFDIAVESGYTDEIGIVANSFGVMSRKINEMINEVYRLGLEKRATELKALQAMINPHFLYNCLSSIKWKAIRADQDEIADITGLLAKFYRTTLNEGKQITHVFNELENIRSYLEIQSRTHGNSFDVEYQIPENGLDCEMPNFLLQPIVENAICHGIDYCEEGQRGLIRVAYIPEEKYLYFHIYNNGPHLEEEQLSKVLNEPGKGYGIYNIQERIRMYYDDECGVSAGVMAEGLICFTIKLKREMVHRTEDMQDKEES